MIKLQRMILERKIFPAKNRIVDSLARDGARTDNLEGQI